MCKFHDASCITEDVAGLHNVIILCTEDAKVVLDEIKLIVKLVMVKLEEVQF